MPIHTHATALQLITFMAFMIVVHVTVQTVAARHSDSPVWQGVAYAVP